MQVPHVVQALASRHAVDVLAMRRGDQGHLGRLGSARVLRVTPSQTGMRGEIASFRRALRRQLEGADYDAVHVRDGWAGVPVLELRDRLGYAVIFDAARGPMAAPPPPDEELAAELARDELACVRRADLVLAPTLAAMQWLEAHGAAGRVHIVPPGVDVDRFDWDFPPIDDPATVLCVGPVRRRRGLRLLARAMADVCARVSARLVLAGPVDSGFARTLQGDAAELGIGNRVEVLGPVEHDAMPALIARASVCVVPAALELSRQPTALFPTKILEFMACRRAVVAPRRGTVTSLLTDGEHGLLFAPGDHAELAAQLIRGLSDPALRERIAGAAYLAVRERYPASATRRALRAAYARLSHRLPERERDQPESIPRGPAPAISAAERRASPSSAAGWVVGVGMPEQPTPPAPRRRAAAASEPLVPATEPSGAIALVPGARGWFTAAGALLSNPSREFDDDTPTLRRGRAQPEGASEKSPATPPDSAR